MSLYDRTEPQHIDYAERHAHNAKEAKARELREGLDVCKVPEHLRDGLMIHCLYGREFGSFLTACLCNDLCSAVCRADEASLAGLRGIMQFLYNYAPQGCWGSMVNVIAWQRRHHQSESAK